MVAFALTFVSLGLIGGLAAGVLGFGGGVLMFPLLYFVPPIFGVERLDANTVAAIVVSQVFFSTLSGGVAHSRTGRVNWRIAFIAGATSAVGSFVGGLASKWLPEKFLLLLFGIVTLAVAGMMFITGPDPDQQKVPVEKIIVPVFPLALSSTLIGIIIGLLGAGNFLFVPLLTYFLRVPIRIAIGSSLFIAMMNTASAFIGKLITAQVPMPATALVVVGAIIGALIGEKIHKRVSTKTLRFAYGTVVTAVAIPIWASILW
jgi:uncharacterized protein